MPTAKHATENRRDRRKAKQSGFKREGTKNPKKKAHHATDLAALPEPIRKRMTGGLKASTNGHAKTQAESIRITPLKQKTIQVRIVGLAPYMQLRFSEKAKAKMMDTQLAGTQAKSKKVRAARNFDEDYEGAMYKMKGNVCGIPAAAFRNACISACKLVGFHMTKAKLAIFVEADGFDLIDGTPLVKIIGKPEKTIMPARNANGSCDLRVRPQWREWSATIRIRFDEDQFSISDIINLLIRVGAQVGIGEGRPDSRMSNGLGMGLFSVEFAGDI